MSTPKPDPFPEDEPSIFDQVDEKAERLADERAEADIAAGRVVPMLKSGNGC